MTNYGNRFKDRHAMEGLEAEQKTEPPRLSTSKPLRGVCNVLKEIGVSSRSGEIYGVEKDRLLFEGDYTINSKVPETVPPKSICL